MGECAQTRANFYQRVARMRFYASDNGINHATINQKVLSETFAWRVVLHSFSRAYHRLGSRSSM
jgi:hypothetical protein